MQLLVWHKLLGETAPLLLIGMSAFVASVPATPLDQSTALPVQIFLWQGNELRNFFEGRTAAAIIVLTCANDWLKQPCNLVT